MINPDKPTDMSELFLKSSSVSPLQLSYYRSLVSFQPSRMTYCCRLDLFSFPNLVLMIYLGLASLIELLLLTFFRIIL